jgi:dCMP deaminase
VTISWDEYFMEVAKLISKRSSCIVKQFGAVITKNNRILSTGYNGTPSQFLNCNEGGCERCTLRIQGKIKSEANAILQNSKECENSILYVTGEPCIQCAKLILAVKISRVVYMKGIYPDNGIFLLKTKSKEKTIMIEEHVM